MLSIFGGQRLLQEPEIRLVAMATNNSQLPMSEQRKAILDRCHEDLVNNMMLNVNVWARLIAENVFSTVEKGKIEGSNTMEEQVSMFLEYMKKKKNGDFDILIECLRDYNQGHVAEILRQADAANTECPGDRGPPGPGFIHTDSD